MYFGQGLSHLFFGVEGSNPVANHGFGAERYLSALRKGKIFSHVDFTSF